MDTSNELVVAKQPITNNIETKYFIEDSLHGIWNDILKFATKQNKKKIIYLVMIHLNH